MVRRTWINGTEVVDGGAIDLDAEDVRLADGSRLTEAGAVLLADEVLRATGRRDSSRPAAATHDLR